MYAIVLFACLLLFTLHQDSWLWNDSRLVFGFLPAGLAYHAMYSLLTAVVWLAVILHAWPRNLEHLANSTEDDKNSTQ